MIQTSNLDKESQTQLMFLFCFVLRKNYYSGLTSVYNTIYELQNVVKSWIEHPNLYRNTNNQIVRSTLQKKTKLQNIIHKVSPQPAHPAQPGHQICPRRWKYWDTYLNCNALHATVNKKNNMSRSCGEKYKTRRYFI